MLGKESFSRANSCFSTSLTSLTNVTSNIGCFQPEVLQTCLFSALCIILPSIKTVEGEVLAAGCFSVRSELLNVIFCVCVFWSEQF